MGFDRTITSEQRQGQYSSTRYHGKYNFGTTGYNPDTMTLTTAKLYLTATASGKSAARPLWLRAGSSTGSPIIAKSNGDKYSVNRQATNEINLLNANSNAETALKNGYFGMYVSSSDDDYYFKTSSGVKYSTHYIKFSQARLLLEWVYKNGTLNLDSTSVNIGSSGGSLTATVGNYQSNYYYRLIVSVGNVTQSYNMGTTSSKSINFADSTWKNAVTNGLFANATSILGTITLQTYSDSNYTVQLGSDSSVPVTFIGTGLEAPTITNVTVSYTNSGSYTSIKDFAISGSGTITVNYTAAGRQGSSIVSQNVSSISTFTSSINSSIITLKPDTSVASGTYYFTLSVTDSRGKTTQTTFSVIVKKYTGPTVNITTVGRVIVNGVEQISVQYSTSFFTGTSFKTGGIIITDANNQQIIEETLTSASGTYITSIEDGISEVEHKITIFIIDSWNTRDSDDKTLVSSTYYLFFGVQKNNTVENGISLGIGGAAPNESNTVYSHWDLKLKNPLDVEYGGTGVRTKQGLKNLLGDLMYPIGSIYMSASDTPPSELFGGAWESWGAGRVPIGVGTGTDVNNVSHTFNAEDEGGEYQHTLTIAESPSHYHVPGREAGASNGSNTYFSTNVTLGTAEVLRDTVGSGSQGGTVIKSTGGAEWLYDTRTTSTVGGDQPHNIIQPYIVCYMWKRIA